MVVVPGQVHKPILKNIKVKGRQWPDYTKNKRKPNNKQTMKETEE